MSYQKVHWQDCERLTQVKLRDRPALSTVHPWTITRAGRMSYFRCRRADTPLWIKQACEDIVYDGRQILN